jgi:hypothetical protein
MLEQKWARFWTNDGDDDDDDGSGTLLRMDDNNNNCHFSQKLMKHPVTIFFSRDTPPILSTFSPDGNAAAHESNQVSVLRASNLTTHFLRQKNMTSY